MSKFNHSIKLHAAFVNSYQLGKASLWGPRISRILENTSSSTLRSIAIGSAAPVSLWTGNRSTKPIKDYAIDTPNLLYETNFVIDRDAWARNEGELFTTESRQLGLYFADHWTKLVSAKLIANPNWYDGVSLFGAHPVLDTTQTNDLTSTELPSLNVGTATAPSAIESGNIINEALMYATGTMVSDANVAINGTAKKFLFVTGSSQIASAYRSAIFSQNLASGQTSPVDGLVKNGYQIEVILDNALAAQTTVSYMFIEDMSNKAFILHSESNVRFELTGVNDNDGLAFQTNNVQVGASQRRSCVVADYTKAFKLTHS